MSECPDRCAYENERPEISSPPFPQVFDFLFDRIEPGGLVPKLCFDVVFGFDFALNGDDVILKLIKHGDHRLSSEDNLALLAETAETLCARADDSV